MSETRAPIWLRWLEYHRENPHVYGEFEQRALALFNAGEKRIGVAMIREVIRYDHSIRTLAQDFKVSNDYTPYYARLLILNRPELAGIIETKPWAGNDATVLSAQAMAHV